jgi:hypothetical protein
MPLKLNSSGGGSVTLDVPVTASTFTATIPANTGTVVTTGSTGVVTQAMMASGVAGNGPAFSAYRSTNQTANTATWTKVQANTEEFDTNSNYDNATNHRFTPTVAGYYQINGEVKMTGAAAILIAAIYKNGSEFKRGTQSGSAASSGQAAAVSALVYFNGSSDYVELYAYQDSGGTLSVEGSGGTNSYFQAFLVRAA